ncbi:MAG: hypothetical protein ACTSVV_18240 [Promethearchaeota archaeon]
MNKKEILSILVIFGGILIIFWGILHAIIIAEIRDELFTKSVSNEIISLITLSYIGIVIMISLNGFLVIIAVNTGLKRNDKLAFIYLLSQGILFAIVSILLIVLQPKISVMGFSGDFILFLAIFTDVCISLLILIPIMILTKIKDK